MLASVRRFGRHLRLPFQMVLAPVFLLGYLLGGGGLDGRLALLFVLLHVGIYGGMTAYNSYYDRDEGPIGGMKHPPTAGPPERYGGLAIQWGAVAWMGWIDPLLGLAGGVLVLLGIAYSHPRWRLKGHPWGSLLTVTGGQGILPFWMGWRAAVPQEAVWGAELPLAGLASALMITGIYPLTQVYQIEEDRRRGDCTFAVRYGAGPVFGLAWVLMAGGLGLMAGAIFLSADLQRFWLGVLPLAYLGFWWILRLWKQRFERQDPYQNHDWSFRTAAATSAALWIFIAVEFFL